MASFPEQSYCRGLLHLVKDAGFFFCLVSGNLCETNKCYQKEYGNTVMHMIKNKITE